MKNPALKGEVSTTQKQNGKTNKPRVEKKQCNVEQLR